jgi:hypothetical protein
MSEMVKRVAGAIREVNNDTIGLSYTELTELMARAAIAAVREPTTEMLMASGLGRTQKARYQAMIDAALALTSPQGN